MDRQLKVEEALKVISSRNIKCIAYKLPLPYAVPMADITNGSQSSFLLSLVVASESFSILC